MKRCAIIGGSGLYKAPGEGPAPQKMISTPYGDVAYAVIEHEDSQVIFIPRHGRWHEKPPHLINYRANISALKLLQVEAIFSSAASGAINSDFKVGDFVLIDQFIDFTKNRVSTFFDEGMVTHIDLTQPYCPTLRLLMMETAKRIGLKIQTRGTYVCTEGPRFETAAEIKAFKILGGDLVGMTNFPEVALARESGICYVTVAIITNMAAGISTGPISSNEVLTEMDSSINRLLDYFLAATEVLSLKGACDCKNALSGADMTSLK